MSVNENEEDQTIKFFEAIKNAQTDKVREFLIQNQALTRKKLLVAEKICYDPDVELSAYRFLGAYIGACSGLQYALLLGYDSIALDIIDVSFDEVLDSSKFGDENTSLHLAAFLNAESVVEALLKRGVNSNYKNGKGFKPIDVTTCDKVLELFHNYT